MPKKAGVEKMEEETSSGTFRIKEISLLYLL